MIRRSSVDLAGVSGVPRAASSRPASAAAGALQRQRDQHGALALGEVVAGRLPGDAGVAVHAEQVVAQLEGLAERQAERR